jgi:hypothetical protein
MATASRARGNGQLVSVALHRLEAFSDCFALFECISREALQSRI